MLPDFEVGVGLWLGMVVLHYSKPVKRGLSKLVSGVDGGYQRGVVVVDPGGVWIEGWGGSFGVFCVCGWEFSQLLISRAWEPIPTGMRLGFSRGGRFWGGR